MDHTQTTWNKFFAQRTKPLWERFPGRYRALVVETNDPLNMYRIRFKCPDLHDWDIKDDECPWATPSFDLGSKKAGRWAHPCKGDWVWIEFERNHPYGTVWVGAATPTRRRFYPNPSIFGITPVSVNEDGKFEGSPDDYNPDYLPQDGRPMSHGWQDRYGNIDLQSSIGYFPIEHKSKPAPPGHDAIEGAVFYANQKEPKVNDPDLKFMARITKYGNIYIMGDQGYKWTAEFTGDVKKDEEYENNRWNLLQRILNEDSPKTTDGNGDQRRHVAMTRYGHKFEMRDVGWNKSRAGEFTKDQVTISDSTTDERWVKVRTKGGMLFQASDIGFAEDDDYVNRHIIDEVGTKTEQENVHWAKKDARWMRLVTRHGIKLVLDDRGSDVKSAQNETPHGNGVLIKGRRSPASKGTPATGNQKGFYWEFNENDLANHTSWGTPLGLTVELNDRYQYAMIAASKGKDWARPWRGLEENEFIGKPVAMEDGEIKSHHLKLDHDNEYIRLKTRSGNGQAPDSASNPSGTSSALNQGFEARDGSLGDGPWVELVDSEHRGIWLTKNYRHGIWRARDGVPMNICLSENDNSIVVFNDVANGKIQLYVNGDIELVGKKIKMYASDTISMKAENAINMQAGDAKLTIENNIITNVAVNAARLNAFVCGVAPGPGAGCPAPGGNQVNKIDAPTLPSVTEPTDRGKTYNGPFTECPRDEIEHPK